MIGMHLSIAGGMHNALLEARGLSLDSVQIFTRNQQQWKCPPLEDDAVAEFHARGTETGLAKNVVAHDSYLINLASSDDILRQKSIEAFAAEMDRCEALRIPYLVTHPGAHTGAGEDEGMARVADALISIVGRRPRGRVTICLETTAGQGTGLGWKFEQLAQLLRRVKRPTRFGVCMDTCHIFAAGYDISTRAKTLAALKRFDQTIGLDRLRVIHLNDSKKPMGSRVDRHAHIGQGHIGLDAFRVFCTDERFADIPKIMELPRDEAPDGTRWDARNLAILRGFRKKRGAA